MLVVGLIGAGINLALWACFFVAQEYEVRIGKLPKRKAFGRFGLSEDFLHIQDYYTTFWGDLIGLTLISAAFAMMLVDLTWQLGFLVTAGVVALLSTFFFHKINAHRRHRPNFACPTHNVLSLSGKLHLIYFLMQAFVIPYAVLAVAFGTATKLATLTFLAGALFYFVTFLVDVMTGRFKRLA